MKKLFMCLVLLGLTKRSQADCDAVLQAVLNTTEWRSEESLDAHLRSYFLSDTFEQDMRNKRFKGKYIDFPKQYSGEYDDQKFHEFRQKLVSDQDFKISTEFKAAYLERKANKDVLDSWIRCHEITTHERTLRLKLQSESDQECVVTLSHAVAGSKAEVTAIATQGCEQKKNGFWPWSKSIKPGAIIDATKPLTATFVKTAGFRDPTIVVSTSIGVETLTLQSFPPVRRTPPEDRFLQPKIVGGETLEVSNAGPPSRDLASEDFDPRDNACLATVAWKVRMTEKWEVEVTANARIWEPRSFQTGFPKYRDFTAMKILASYTDLIPKYGTGYEPVLEFGEGKVFEGIFSRSCRPGSGGNMEGASRNSLIKQASMNAGGGKAEGAYFDLIVPEIDLTFEKKNPS